MIKNINHISKFFLNTNNPNNTNNFAVASFNKKFV